MPIKFPDLLQNNNPNYPIADITNIRGNAYPLSLLSDTGSIPTDKRKIGTIVFVSTTQEYYGYYGTTTGNSDWNNGANWKSLIGGTTPITNILTGYISTGSIGTGQTISGSLIVIGGVTASLFGTASWATNTLTSSFVPNALYTASVNVNTITFTKGDGTQFPITVQGTNVDTASLVTTASFNPFTQSFNQFTASYNTGSFSGSFIGIASTASYVSSSNVYGPYGFNSILTASYAVNVSNVSSSYPFNATGSSIYSYNANMSDIGSTQNSISQYNNFIVGEFAGTTFTSESFSNSIIIGSGSAYRTILNNNNIFLGESSGARTQRITGSIFIGRNSGRYTLSGSNSITIGDSSGENSLNIVESINIGTRAGRNAISNRFNIFIGYQAGSAANPINGLSQNNIVIGNNITLKRNSRDSINIGGIIFATGSHSGTGSMSSTSVSNTIARVGICTPNPTATFQVSGTVSFPNLTDEGRTWVVTYDTASGQLYYTASTSVPGTGTPGQPNLSIQFNDGGRFSGSSNLIFDTTQSPNRLTLTGSLSISGSTTQIGSNTLQGNTTLSGSVIISGSNPPGSTTASLQIYGDIQQAGYHRFDPVTTNIDQSVTASYIYVSGSTRDLYFTQNGNGYNNTTRLRWLEGNLYTGLLHGGVISASAGSTVFAISSGSGVIVNLNASTGSDPYPTIKLVEWGNITGITPSFLTSKIQTFVGLDSGGAVIQRTEPWTDGLYNTSLQLGTVLHQNKSTINATITYPNTAYGYKQRTYDFVKAFGPLKLSGYELLPSGTLGLTVGSGTAFSDGRNYQNDPNNPAYITDPGTTVSKIFRYYQSGSEFVQDTNNGAGYTVIDPSKYVDINGVLQNVGNNNFSNQRVFWYPNSATKGIVVYYGTSAYADRDSAVLNAQYERFSEVENTKQNAVYLGTIVIKGSGDFNNTNDYRILPSGIFRSVTGGGGTTINVTALSNLSDVAVSSISTGDLLVYGNGSQWNNTKILNGNYTISGSLSLTNGVTGSLHGTASWANNAETASHILGGRDNYIALWTGSQNLTSSIIYQTGSSIGINSVTPTGSLYVSGAIYFPSLTASTDNLINVLLYNTASGQLYYTASNTLPVTVFPFSGSAVITGSLNVTNGITGSFLGTASNAATASNVLGGANGYLALWTGSTILTSSIIYQTGSSIGINSTTPTGSLYVSGAIYFPSLIPSGGTATVLMYNSASGQLFYTASDAITIKTTGPGAQNYLAFFSGSTTAISSSNVYYDRVNNFIGINKATPADSLDVVGGIRGTTFLYGVNAYFKMSLGQPYTNIYSEANNQILLGEVGKFANFVFSPTLGSLLIGTNQSSQDNTTAGLSLQILSGSNTLLAVSQSGNVGIGISTPTAKLHISGSTPLRINGLTNPSTTIGNVLVIDSNGQVFVTGSSALAVPTFPFNGSAVITGSLLVSGSSPTVTISGSLNVSGSIVGSLLGTASWANNAQTASNITGGSAGYLALWMGSTALSSSLLYQTGSRIGLGTTTPTASLDIIGDLNISITTDENVGVIKQNSTPLIHTYGTASIYIGSGSGNFTYSGTGQNVAIGHNSLKNLTTAHSNTAVGNFSLGSTTAGQENTALGFGTLFTNTTGRYNVALGYNALYSHSTGDHNIAIGKDALFNIAVDDNNIGIGSSALNDLISGTQNLVVGYASGLGIVSGSHNTIIGSNVSGLSANLSNNIIIADGQGNRRINVDSAGNVAIGKNTPNARLDIFGNSIVSGSLYVTSSVFLSGLTTESKEWVITYDSQSGQLYYTASSTIKGAPGGLDTQIQFNQNNVLSGDSAFEYIYTSQSLQQGLNTIAFGQYSHAEGLLTKTGITDGYSASITNGTASLAPIYGNLISVFFPGPGAGGFGNNRYLLYKTGSTYGYSRIINQAYPALNTNLIFLEDRTLNTGTDTIVITDIALNFRSGSESLISNYAHTEGSGTVAIGDYSHAEGREVLSYGLGSHAEGYRSRAIGEYSHAEGRYSRALNTGSHAEGLQTRALGIGSHAEGRNTLASGSYSHAEGDGSQALGDYSHAEGENTLAYAKGSRAEGTGTSTGITNAFSASISSGLVSISDVHGNVTASFYTGSYLFINDSSLNEYKAKKIDTVSYSAPNTLIQLIDTAVNVTSTQVFDTKRLFDTNATGNTTGFNYNILGVNAHAEGSSTTAIDLYAHSEGLLTQAIGQYSHAEGYKNQSVGFTSHAEGNETRAIGYASNTKGAGTIAEGAYQLVIGEYNIPNEVRGAFIIGNGTLDIDRSNLLETSGSEIKITGSLITTGGSVSFKSLTTSPKDRVVLWDSVDGTLYVTASSAFGSSGATGAGFPFNGSAVITGSLLVSGSSPTVTISGSLNVTNGITGSLLGTASFATDVQTNSTNTQILFNSGSKLAGTGSFLFIYTNQSLQQGNEVTASGRFSHAQGSGSRATGIASHAEGLFTVAAGNYQHVVGQYNISSSAQSAFIIGNGINDSNRSNLVFAASSSFQITGSLNITGSQTTLGTAIISSSGDNVLNIYGSGSTNPIFNVEGSVGPLLKITDTITGSLFSVNNATGLPIFEVFSDNTTYIGNYPTRGMYASNDIVTTTGLNTLYSIRTGSFDAMFVDYTIRSGSAGRAGNIIAMWSGSSTSIAETSNLGFGNTTGSIFQVDIDSGEMVLKINTPSDLWRVKTIIKAI